MSKYKSRHTGATIDDAISRALPGGAIDISLANKTDGERRNYAEVGGAVGWYRICIGGARYERCRAIVSLTHLYSDMGASDLLLDVNTDEDVKGLRCLAYGGKGLSNPIVTKARVVGLSDYKQAIDVYYNTATNGNRWVIGVVNLGKGTFSIQTPTFVAADDTLPDGETLIAPMEWVNPPMELGKEYRTTERYQGKPVYAKLVNFGALPNSTTARVAHGVENIGYRIFVGGDANGEPLVTRSGISYITAGTSDIVIATSSNLSAITAHVLLKYTKSTD